MLKTVSKNKRHELTLKNERPDIDNVIYAVSHYCCYDFQYASEVIGKRCWVLVGKQRFDFISLIGLLINGIIWVDRKSKTHKKKAVKRVKNLLEQGENVLIFPEGTWNMSYSLPIMPLYWGVIDIAKESDRPIIPLILDYDYEEGRCVAAFGKPIVVKMSDDKAQMINELRDEMATLKWSIWEEKSIYHRAEIKLESWKEELDTRLAEYPLLDFEYEKSIIRNH